MTCLVIAVAVLASGGEETTGRLTVAWDEKTRGFEIADAELGPVLQRLEVPAGAGEAGAWAPPPKEAREGFTGGERRVFHFPPSPDGRAPAREVVFEIPDGGERVVVRSRQAGSASGVFAMGESPIVGYTLDERPNDRKVLTMTLGPAELRSARSIFDPARDLAVTVSAFEDGVELRGPAGARGGAEGASYSVSSRVPAGEVLLELRIRRHYYRDTLGIRFYAPIEKRSYWRTAPAVAMTWYGIEGWKGRPAQRKEWLLPQIAWVAEHFLPYTEHLVFQLDDNYPKDDDRIMRELSDAIRTKGMIPGIWFTPFTVAPRSEYETHPEWFIHGPDRKPLRTFGGVIYDGFTLNVNDANAVERWFGRWWKRASETWNFDFFKIDGQPEVASAYRKSVDGGGHDGYRKGLMIGRRIVGRDKFINGCWGTAVEGIGIMNGARTGGDTGNDPHAIPVIIRWNFLNNVAWWSDPDAAANLFRATVERVRLNTQARALTGQQFLTDDVWTRIPEANAYVLQRGLPTLDIRPANLYPIEDGAAYDHFDLKVRKPFGEFDVVGIFNYTGAPKTMDLDLGRLDLRPGTYHVFDYWDDVSLGRHDAGARIPLAMEPYEGKLFRVTRKDRGACVVSTSRHMSQGGLDLERVRVVDGPRRTFIEGTSSHLVANDPYTIAVDSGVHRVVEARADQGKVTWSSGGGVSRLRILPERSGDVQWAMTLEVPAAPILEVSRTRLDLGEGPPGEVLTGRLGLDNIGPGSLRWRAVTDAPWLRTDPAEGSIGAHPAPRTWVALKADLRGLAHEMDLRGTVKVLWDPRSELAEREEAREAKGEAPGADRYVLVEVRARTSAPPDLAREGKATASSIWGPGYEAGKANDGTPSTRWNSAQGDRDGAWWLVEWPEPRTFGRAVIDECIDFGPRVEEWVLEVWDGTWKEVGRGKGLGRNHEVRFPPVTATRLRLTIRKASVVPTIWEVRVHGAP